MLNLSPEDKLLRRKEQVKKAVKLWKVANRKKYNQYMREYMFLYRRRKGMIKGEKTT